VTPFLIIILSTLFFIKIFSVVVLHVMILLLFLFLFVAHLVAILSLICGEVHVGIRVMKSSCVCAA
jgi:hypothetical protein